MTIKPLISMDPFMSKAFKDPQNLVALTTDDDKLVFSLLAARLSSAHLVEYNPRLWRSFHVSNFDTRK